MLKIIIKETIFVEFEKSELQQSNLQNIIRNTGFILQNFSKHQFFIELSNTANGEMKKESQILEKNKVIFNVVQQKLNTLDAGQISQVLNIYNQRGMWGAINYIQIHT